MYLIRENMKASEAEIQIVDFENFRVVEKGNQLYSSEMIEKIIDGKKVLLFSPEYNFIPTLSSKYACIWGDWNLNPHIVLENIKKFQVIFMDMPGKHIFGEFPTEYFPIYALWSKCADFENIKRWKDRDINVIFIGNLNQSIHKRRNRILANLLCEDVGLKVVFGVWDVQKYCELLSNSKIAFNMSVRREMNMRSFEAGRCGAVLFVEKENVEVWSLLREWEHAVPYSESNVLENIKKVLSDPAGAVRMAENLRRKIKDEFDPKKLWDKLRERLKEVRTEKYRKSEYDDVVTFRSLVNSLVKYQKASVKIPEPDAKSAEFRASLLNDLGVLHFFAGNLKTSVKLFEASQTVFPSLVHWFNLVMTLFKLDDKSFERECEKLVSSFVMDEQKLLRNIRGMPDVFFPLPLLGYDEKKVEMDAIWIKYRNNTYTLARKISAILISHLLEKLGEKRAEKEDFAEATKLFERSLKLFPSSSAMRNLAVALLKAGKKSESADVALRYWQKFPFDFFAWDTVAKALYSAGRVSELEKALAQMEKIARGIYIKGGARLKVLDRIFEIKDVSGIAKC